MAGGKRYVPIDLERSISNNEAEYNYDDAYKNKYSLQLGQIRDFFEKKNKKSAQIRNFL